jgi:NAD-dependent dihydropyrimidine dehydrogenase PreA subunit/flavodoxin
VDDADRKLSQDRADESEPLDALVAFGTMRGTTAVIGEAIAEGLGAAGATASAVHLDLLGMMPGRIAKADLLGFGSPVYYQREAAYVADFIRGLPSLEGKKAFVWCSCGMNRIGETLLRLQTLLSERGAVVVGAQHFSSAMSYLPYRKRNFGNPDHMPDESVLAAARDFGRRMAQARELAPIALPPVSLATRLKARLVASRRFRRLFLPAITIKDDACTGYGSCISRCPFRGLDRKNGEDVPFVTDACIQCLQCIDFCPKAAITTDAPVKEWISALSYRLGVH